MAGMAGMAAKQIASFGGKGMHSKSAAVRKISSKALGFGGAGGGAKIETILKGMKGGMMASLKVLGKIAKGVGKFVAFMAKFSPALKQQITILSKGLGLMLRPIGDIMAKFMRPMAVWVMKVAQKWYAIFGTGGGNSELSKDDAIDQAEKQLKSAEAGGDPTQILDAQNNLDAVTNSYAKDSGDEAGGLGFKNLFANLIPEAFMDTLKSLGSVFQELWGIVVELGKVFWDALGPTLTSIAEIVGVTLLFALKGLEVVLDVIAFAFKMVGEGIKILPELFELAIAWIDKFGEWLIKLGGWLGGKLLDGIGFVVDGVKLMYEWYVKFGDWLDQKFIEGIKAIWQGMKDMYNWITDIGSKMWDGIKDGFKSMINWVINKLNKVPGVNIKTYATGGEIDKTGMYQLHAGERVLTAGDNQRANGGSNSTTINNVFNISATLNNDIDIRTLADKLADLNEIELRRRVSYI